MFIRDRTPQKSPLTHVLACLLEGDEARRVGGSHTGASVEDRSVREGELSEVGSNHLTLLLLFFFMMMMIGI